MSRKAPGNPALADALLAARLFADAPARFGGMVLRGGGPVRDRLLEEIDGALPGETPRIKIPINVDDEQLLGGLDLAETLASGIATERSGLIERARGGIAIVAMAERVSPGTAAHLAQAVDRGELSLVLLDDGLDDDELPPAALMERAAFHCDLSAVRTPGFELTNNKPGKNPRRLTKKQRAGIAATAAAVGVHSIRPVVFAERAALSLAAMRGATGVDDEHLQDAMRLVLAPRAQELPASPETAPPPESEAPSPDSDSDLDDRTSGDMPLEDLLLEAVQAAIPQHILDGIANGTLRHAGARAGKSGQKERSAIRGRPRGSLPGTPGEGRRLALIDTLRAAAPWQTIRRAEADIAHNGTLQIRKSDLRICRFEQNRESLTIFAVDASGSSALARLAEAKGAVELMLAQAHVKRSQVALIAFRQTGTEILLPPTRSLTRARRALGGLPGGGGTPLAAGLLEARLMADAAEKRGQTPTIAVLTDGKANVTLEGEPGRDLAMKQAEDAAKGIAIAGHHAVVIDISPRPREEAAQLADVLQGNYVPLPHANGAEMVAAITAVGVGRPAREKA